MENNIEIKDLNLEWLGLLFLSFFFSKEMKVPEGFKEIYDKYADKNGNIIRSRRVHKGIRTFYKRLL